MLRTNIMSNVPDTLSGFENMLLLSMFQQVYNCGFTHDNPSILFQTQIQDTAKQRTHSDYTQWSSLESMASHKLKNLTMRQFDNINLTI